jgi:hypothetical protein
MSEPLKHTATPEQATELAQAAVRIEMKVPEVEKLLVNHGLDLAAAEAVVYNVLENQTHEQFQRQVRSQRRLRIHRVLSASVVLLYLMGAFWVFGIEGVLRVALGVCLPMACIWFPDAMGKAHGPTGAVAPVITMPTPGGMLRIGGWVLLLAPGVTGFVTALMRR